jgi:hypothetical protein
VWPKLQPRVESASRGEDPAELLGKNFDGNLSLQFGVARSVHLTHATFSDQGIYLKGAD